MKSLVLVIAIFVSVGTATASTRHDGYLVKIKQPISARSLSVFSRMGIEVRNTIPELNIVSVNTNSAQTRELARADFVEYIEPNYIVRALGSPKDIYQKEAEALWGMHASYAHDAWRLTTGNPEVIVAVSDTGIWLDHSDLAPNIWRNPGENGKDANGKDKSKNKVDDDGNGFVDDYAGWNFGYKNNNPNDDHYHGTHVAGTVGAKGNDGSGIAGVAWNVKIMALKFLGMSGEGTNEDGILTILYAANNGAKAINCSWGGDPYSQATYDAIEYAKSKNMLVIAAAGNDGTNNDKTVFYPAGYTNDNVIAVAATYPGNTDLAGFSNYGAKSVHIAAPGDRIFSAFNARYKTLYCENPFYCTLSGTSMAAPHVTGTVALMYSANPKLTYKQVKDILIAGVTKTKKLEGKVVAGGTLNICNSVRGAQAISGGNQ